MNRLVPSSLGSVGQWLYEHVARIRATVPGYARVLLAPEPGELEWAEATYDSVRGPIRGAWRVHDGKFSLEVEIPPNLTVEVVIPGPLR